jgi:hypothetical protein
VEEEVDFYITNNGTITVSDILINDTEDIAISGSGSLTLTGDIQVNDPSTLAFNGSGSIAIGGDISLNATATVTNNNSGSFTVTDDLIFNDEVDFTFTNNQPISIQSILLTDVEDATISGSGSISVSGNLQLDDINCTLTVNNSAALTIGGDIDVNSTGSILFTGSSTVAVTDDILISVDNDITYSKTGQLTANELNFEAGSNGASFTNNQTANFSGNITFNDIICSVTNGGTLSIANITTGNNADDDNVITNNNGAILNVVAIDPNQADMDIFNSGTINQSGSFGAAADIDAADTNFDNLATGVWNWSLTPNSGYDTDLNTVMDLTAVGNTFNYNGAGAQSIIITTHHNVTLSTSGIKSAQANLDFNGNLLISGTAQLSVDTGDRNFNLGGNWTVTSTNADPFVQGSTTETVTFDGTGAQTISTVLGTETFRNLTVNKSSGNVILSSGTPTSATVSNVLTLTNGGLDLNGRTLNITNGAITAITRTNGFIRSETTAVPYGRVTWTMGVTSGAHLIPFGLASGAANYIPFTFDITAVGVGVSGTISVATYATATNNTPLPFTVDHVQDASGADNSANTVDRFWIVTSGGYTTQPTARLTFTATTTEVGSISPLRAQLWDGSNWDPPLAGQVVTATSAQLGSGTINYLQIWAMADNDSPLPIELTTFEATQQGSSVKLYWETASELNNDFFTIERLNEDQDDFIALSSIKGKGTTSERTAYTSYDYSAQKGKNYYRLKQTDFDGKFSYSSIQLVEFYLYDKVIETYPNPSREGPVFINARSFQPFEEISIQITSALGVELMPVTLSADEKGSASTTISTKGMKPGIYVVRAVNNPSLTKRLVIE